MCGIVGVRNKKGDKVSELKMTAFNFFMLHIDSDARSGRLKENNVNVHRKLNIMDLSDRLHNCFIYNLYNMFRFLKVRFLIVKITLCN